MAIETEMCRQNTQELIQDNYPHSKDVVAFPSVGLNRGRDLKHSRAHIHKESEWEFSSWISFDYMDRGGRS